jgi:hypothetical protein
MQFQPDRTMQEQSQTVLSMSACRYVSGPNEIENASRVRPGYARPDRPRRFIRGPAEDAKFEENREVIIDPAVDAGFRAT